MMQRLKLFLVGLVGAWSVRALLSTVRVRYEGREFERAVHDRGERIIYAFWHGRLLIPLYTHRKRGIHVMASLSRDGEIIARILHRLGFRTVRGSSSRKGARALVDLARAAKSGYDAAVTPDGPRGPRYKVQRGVTSLARLTGCPILPCGIEPARYKQLGSWDECRIPYPFTRVVIVMGEPFYVPRDSTEEQERELAAELERKILAASSRATALARGAAKS
jgi:lysophospholipid acyltransferase (LPLAT)-like uncharacterized protein